MDKAARGRWVAVTKPEISCDLFSLRQVRSFRNAPKFDGEERADSAKRKTLSGNPERKTPPEIRIDFHLSVISADRALLRSGRVL